MLFGRQMERARIERLLNGARQGRGGALVIRGAPGIGKTALLRYAIDLGEAMTVVRATGVESEAELEYSGLSELCRPLLAEIEALPEHQAETLRGALGLTAARPGDRFAVGAATLGLLALAAESRPVLVVVDDVQWLDAASVEALAFAARRLADDAVAFLFAVRDDAAVLSAGFDELAVEGLDPAAAQRLLDEVAGGAVPEEVVTAVLEATRGNPLGLVELPRVLTPEQLAGSERMPEPLPVGAAVARAYSSSIEALPEETQRALVVLAVSSSGEVDLLAKALGGAAALEPAEDAGLIDLVDGRFVFRHPLVRSAVVQTAAPSARRAAHRLLADALAERGAEERRAWHLAAAVVGHDEDAAQALAAVAARARDRGGFEAAAEGFEQSARLTLDAAARASRLAAAAEAAWSGGDSARAGALVAEVLPGCTDPDPRLRMLRLRGRIELQTGSAQRARDLFLDGASELELTDPAGAIALLGLAVAACHHGGLMDEALVHAERVRELVPRDGSPADRQAEYALGRALSLAGRTVEAAAVLGPVLDGLLALESPSREELVSAALAAATLERDAESRELAVRATELARVLGPMTLVQTLTLLAEVHVRQGEWQRAVAAATEGLDLARDLGQQSVATYFLQSLVRVEAARGNEQAARTWADEVRPVLGASGVAVPAAGVGYALGLLELGLERLDEAVVALEASARSLVAIDIFARPLLPEADLVEALVRLGRGDDARGRVERVERGSRWTAALAARCRGLLASDDGFDAEFEDALRLHGELVDPFAEARTRLCYGERLRRAGRRVDARPQLRAALAAFELLEATAWIKRVRRELRATGEKLGRRAAASGDALTSQELQVALQVAEGKTNREVGAALFLSPKTVEFHLARVYRKLELSSRAGLVRHFAEQGGAVLAGGGGAMSQAEKAAAFAALHEGEPFVIPNPWDAGSARVLEALGFKALATTSSGFAFTLGRLDGGTTLDEVVEHTAALDAATALPVAVDLENGYGAAPEAAANAVARVAEAGAVGGSIEDWDPAGHLYEPAHATERIAAAAETAHGLGFPFLLAARAENHIRGNPDLDDTIARLQSYERAGADVLYAPGLRTADDIRAVCDAVTKPVNVLALPHLTLAEIFEAGAQRVSVGGALAWVAAKAFADAAIAIRDQGDLSALAARLPLGDWLG